METGKKLNRLVNDAKREGVLSWQPVSRKKLTNL
jgi:hypothetical protein